MIEQADEGNGQSNAMAKLDQKRHQGAVDWEGAWFLFKMLISLKAMNCLKLAAQRGNNYARGHLAELQAETAH